MEGTPGFSYELAQVCNRKGRGSGGVESSQLANIYMESDSLLFQWSSYEIQKDMSKINQQKYQVLIPISTWMIVFFLSSASNFYKQNWKHNTCNFYILLIFFYLTLYKFSFKALTIFNTAFDKYVMFLCMYAP